MNIVVLALGAKNMQRQFDAMYKDPVLMKRNAQVLYTFVRNYSEEGTVIVIERGQYKPEPVKVGAVPKMSTFLSDGLEKEVIHESGFVNRVDYSYMIKYNREERLMELHVRKAFDLSQTGEVGVIYLPE